MSRLSQTQLTAGWQVRQQENLHSNERKLLNIQWWDEQSYMLKCPVNVYTCNTQNCFLIKLNSIPAGSVEVQYETNESQAGTTLQAATSASGSAHGTCQNKLITSANEA